MPVYGYLLAVYSVCDKLQACKYLIKRLSVSKLSLQKIAEKQYGYFTSSQAVSEGFVYQNHNYHVKHGHWLAVSKRLYRLPGFSDTMESCFTRWCLWSSNQRGQFQAIISHRSALAYYGLAGFDERAIEVTVPREFRKKLPEGLVLNKQILSLSAIDDHGSFMITKPEQTLLDMKDVFTNEEWMRTLHHGISSGMISRNWASQFGGTLIMAMPVNVNAVNTATACEGIKAAQEKVLTVPDCIASTKEGVWQMIYDRTMPKRKSYRAGFTLVELLVVLAIISVLAALLLPSLKKAMNSAHMISCLSNMKQITLGFEQYFGDNNEHYPIGRFWDTGARGQLPSVSWSETVAENIGYNTAGPIPQKNTFRCPVDDINLKTNAPRSYRFSGGIGYSYEYSGSHWFSVGVDYCKRGKVKYPSTTIVLSEVMYEWGTISNLLCFVFRTDAPGDLLSLATWHNNSSNYLFADGHAEWLPLSPEARDPRWYFNSKY